MDSSSWYGVGMATQDPRGSNMCSSGRVRSNGWVALVIPHHSLNPADGEGERPVAIGRIALLQVVLGIGADIGFPEAEQGRLGPVPLRIPPALGVDDVGPQPRHEVGPLAQVTARRVDPHPV